MSSIRSLAAAAVVASLGAVLVAAAAPSNRPVVKPDDGQALFQKAVLELVANHDADAAEKLARQGLSKFPAEHGFHLVLGDVHNSRKDYADAYYEWQWEFFRSGPNNVTGEKAAERIKKLLSTVRGTSSDEVRLVFDIIEKTSTEPKQSYDRLVRIEKERGNRFVLTLFKAEALTGAGEKAKAQALYREMLQKDPYFVPAYVQLAGLLRKSGNETEADKMMAKARSIDPKHWQLTP